MNVMDVVSKVQVFNSLMGGCGMKLSLSLVVSPDAAVSPARLIFGGNSESLNDLMFCIQLTFSIHDML